jgi:hypothetical protein
MPPTPSTRLSDLPSRTAAVLLPLAAPASAASRAPPPASPGDTRKAASSPLRRSPRAHAPAGGFGAAAEAGLPSPASNSNRVEAVELRANFLCGAISDFVILWMIDGRRSDFS